MTYYNRFGEPEMSDDELFSLLNKALAPKPSKPRQPRLVLAKSILTAVKRKPVRPSKPVLVVPSKILSDRELLGGLSDAVARGWLTGHDALAAEKLVQAGQSLPKSVRAAILGRGRK